MVAVLLAQTPPTVWGIPLTGAVMFGIYRVVQTATIAANRPENIEAVKEFFRGPESKPLTPTFKPNPLVVQRVAALQPGAAPPDQSLGSSFVFISYKHKDRAAALKLKEQLRGEAFSVWIDSDQLKAGASWNRAIQGAIEHCAVVVCLMSGQEPSEVVEQELQWAKLQDKTIVPISLNGGRYFEVSGAQHEKSSDGSVSQQFLVDLRQEVQPSRQR